MSKNIQTALMLASLLNISHGPLAGKMPRDLWDGGAPDTDLIIKEVKDIGKTLSEKITKQADEIRAQGETSKKTAQEIAALEKKYDALQSELNGKLEAIEAKSNRLGGSGKEEEKSYGRLLVETEGYQKKNFRPGNTRVELKATLTSGTTSAGAFIRPERLPVVVRPNVRQRVRNLLAQGTTSSNAIEYVRETGFTNNAAPVAEGIQKPESGLTFEVVTAAVRTIAHWIPITRQAAEDAGQIEAYVEGRLLDGLGNVEDDQLLFGSGTGQDLEGIVTLATAYNRRQTGDTFIDTLRRAFTQVRNAELIGDGIVLNPEDWETIELAKDNEARYIWISVNDGGVPRIFRVPVIDTTAMTQNTFLVGAFQTGAQLFDRQEAVVEVSDQDRDNFIKNLLTMRAEQREVLAVYRPEGFITGEFEETP